MPSKTTFRIPAKNSQQFRNSPEGTVGTWKILGRMPIWKAFRIFVENSARVSDFARRHSSELEDFGVHALYKKNFGFLPIIRR